MSPEHISNFSRVTLTFIENSQIWSWIWTGVITIDKVTVTDGQTRKTWVLKSLICVHTPEDGYYPKHGNFGRGNVVLLLLFYLDIKCPCQHDCIRLQLFKTVFFLPKHNSVHQWVELCNTILNSLEKKILCCSVFLCVISQRLSIIFGTKVWYTKGIVME